MPCKVEVDARSELGGGPEFMIEVPAHVSMDKVMERFCQFADEELVFPVKAQA